MKVQQLTVTIQGLNRNDIIELLNEVINQVNDNETVGVFNTHHPASKAELFLYKSPIIHKSMRFLFEEIEINE